MSDMPELLGLAAAAADLGVSHATLRAQVHRGRLRAQKVGRDWVVSVDEVERYRIEVQGHDGRRDRQGRAK